MTILVDTAYGELPLMIYTLVRLKLGTYADQEWKIKKDKTFWQKLGFKGGFRANYIEHYAHNERHPNINIKGKN